MHFSLSPPTGEDCEFSPSPSSLRRGSIFALRAVSYKHLVFIFAAVLIMYYKQVSEGYEDQSRFGIMQKVGMTQKDIKRSINSQILTVFFLPLLTAGVHLAFAFPLIQKILVLFSLTDRKLLILVTVCFCLIFAFFYVLVYHITSKAYFAIVSGAKGEPA